VLSATNKGSANLSASADFAQPYHAIKGGEVLRIVRCVTRASHWVRPLASITYLDRNEPTFVSTPAIRAPSRIGLFAQQP
jgi:hypothetical protein